MAAIGAAHLMLDHLGFKTAARHLENAKVKVIQEMASMLAAKMGYSTSELGDMVCDALAQIDQPA